MSDIRQGRFKKLLVPIEQLQLEAPEISRRLSPLFILWKEKKINDAELAALWCLLYLRVRHPRSWWGSKRSTPLTKHQLNLQLLDLDWNWSSEELALINQYQTLGNLWNHRSFKATPEAVHRSILSWSTGLYPLVLMERVPSVEEVLEQQMKGQRCVTLFSELNSLAKLILGERDALGFAFHDLIHADHFFHDNTLMKGQIGFYHQINTLLRNGMLDPFMANGDFPEQLDYLVADMNSHPVHLWKCFKSICRQANHAEMDELIYSKIPKLWDLNETLSDALIELNGPNFSLEIHATALLKWCESF